MVTSPVSCIPIENPSYKDVSLRSFLTIVFDKPLTSPSNASVSSIWQLNVNIRKTKKGKKPNGATGLEGGLSGMDESGFVPLSQCIKDDARVGSSLFCCTSSRELRIVKPIVNGLI